MGLWRPYDDLSNLAEAFTIECTSPLELAHLNDADINETAARQQAWYAEEAVSRYGFVAARGIELGLVRIMIEACGSFAATCHECPLTRAGQRRDSRGEPRPIESWEGRYSSLRDQAAVRGITAEEFDIIAGQAKRSVFELAKGRVELIRSTSPEWRRHFDREKYYQERLEQQRKRAGKTQN